MKWWFSPRGGRKQHIGAFLRLIDDNIVAGGEHAARCRLARSDPCCSRRWASARRARPAPRCVRDRRGTNGSSAARWTAAARRIEEDRERQHADQERGQKFQRHRFGMPRSNCVADHRQHPMNTSAVQRQRTHQPTTPDGPIRHRQFECRDQQRGDQGPLSSMPARRLRTEGRVAACYCGLVSDSCHAGLLFHRASFHPVLTRR